MCTMSFPPIKSILVWPNALDGSIRCKLPTVQICIFIYVFFALKKYSLNSIFTFFSTFIEYEKPFYLGIMAHEVYMKSI